MRLLMVAVPLALTAASACSAVRDERGAACGLMDEPVAAQVAMAHARDYRLHFPLMGFSPELDIDDRPAFAVAFARPIDLPGGGPGPLGGQAQPRGPDSGVVCVVIGDATTYYVNVDISGWRP